MTTWTKAGTDVPGAIGDDTFYFPHLQCRLAVWRQPGSYQDAPCAVFVHGEQYGCGPGWGSMTSGGALANGHLQGLAQELYDAGYCIVSIDYPTASKYVPRAPGSDWENFGEFRIYSSWSEIHPISLWPEQPRYVGHAVQFIKSNWSAVPGATDTVRGTDLWGAGNSIDPSRVVMVADKWGATLALQCMLQTTGDIAFERDLAHESYDSYVPRASHRVAALILRNPGPIDFTQFYVTPDYSIDGNIPEALSGDRFCPVMRGEGQRRWGSGTYGSYTPSGGNPLGPMVEVVHPQWKRCSPWWLLQRQDSENCNLPIHVEWSESGFASAKDTNLSATDWEPGVMADDAAGGHAWVNPYDHRIQAQALRDALQEFGGPDGDGTPIRQSVVNDPSSTEHPSSSAAAYPANVVSWLESLGI